MSLTPAQLRSQLTEHDEFSVVEQLNESVFRSVRTHGNSPFAVYYFDITQDPPNTEEALAIYQDKVIGSRYFNGEKSLQWSNYLYFISAPDRLCSDEWAEVKNLIESDRNYARKFVISEEELEDVLRPRIVKPEMSDLQSSILSVWQEVLSTAGLDQAIFTDGSLPRRLELIESSSAVPANGKPVQIKTIDVDSKAFIDTLELKKFRRFPLQRTLTFGTVNLIFGANGCGKTSLLEAIELFYCGRNKRNHNEAEPYELVVKLGDGRTREATKDRLPQEFRSRNLSWYSQAEVGTNDLYQSFAKFNFLNTDAAVSLAESTEEVEEDLSKLLVGPDAAKAWREIGRVHEAVEAKLRELLLLQSHVREDLSEQERLIEQSAHIMQESDSIAVRLKDMMQRVGWRVPNTVTDGFASGIVESLSELESLCQQTGGLDWVESPASLNGLADFCEKTKITCEQSKADIDQLERLREGEKHYTSMKARGEEALRRVAQVKRFINAGHANRTKELRDLQETVDILSGILVGSDEVLRRISQEEQDVELGAYLSRIESNRFHAETSMFEVMAEYAHFSELRGQSIILAQQLREIAMRILDTSGGSDECPLCHSTFGPGELTDHIHRDVDEHLEQVGRRLLEQVRQSESMLREALAAESTAGSLKRLCDRLGIAASITIQHALLQIEEAGRILSQAKDKLQTLKDELLALESEGLSSENWNHIIAQLHELKHPLTEVSPDKVDQLFYGITEELESSSRAAEILNNLTERLQLTLESVLGLPESSIEEMKREISQLRERHIKTEALRSRLLGFSATFPWPDEMPLAELAVVAAAIRNVGAKLQTSLGTENQANAAVGELTTRRNDLTKQLVDLSKIIDRLTEARATFQFIKTEHSLSAAVQSALDDNRTSIESIFKRIHSPTDFQGIGSNLSTLVRTMDGSEAKLSQISTGQRAAFALSIFLAQNSHLEFAPPVLLIDDPMAYVDDLNALSFFDYLREIALTGERQIFFATASDKLATLFERKFDFLGEKGFRRFNLSRGA